MACDNTLIKTLNTQTSTSVNIKYDKIHQYPEVEIKRVTDIFRDILEILVE